VRVPHRTKTIGGGLSAVGRNFDVSKVTAADVPSSAFDTSVEVEHRLARYTTARRAQGIVEVSCALVATYFISV
jgi:hypothetical protein